MVPVESGPGKPGTPWEPMQAAYSTPAAVPTVVEMLAPIPAPPGGSPKASGWPVALLLDVVVPRFATGGDFEPPPQPATSSPTAASTSATMPGPAAVGFARTAST